MKMDTNANKASGRPIRAEGQSNRATGTPFGAYGQRNANVETQNKVSMAYKKNSSGKVLRYPGDNNKHKGINLSKKVYGYNSKEPKAGSSGSPMV